MLPACLVADFMPLSLIHAPGGDTIFSPSCPLPSFIAPSSLYATIFASFVHLAVILLLVFLLTANPAQAKPYLLLLTPSPIFFLSFYSLLRLFSVVFLS
jgi:hypothetical protein